ncbi:MAG TPA: MarR family transcriptional regulator [Elusimicrobiota bacterium]|nr:MarR family transcriptional regulator [Elusimicrobiota bacterium]
MNKIEPHDKARRLAEEIQILIDNAEGAERESPELAEKLSRQELRTLRAVGQCVCPIMSGIAAAVRLSLSSVTGLIDRLSQKNLVRRDRSSDDRRVVQVVLTDEGRAVHEATKAARAAFAQDVLKALSPAEQDELVLLLGKVSNRLQREKRQV